MTHLCLDNSSALLSVLLSAKSAVSVTRGTRDRAGLLQSATDHFIESTVDLHVKLNKFSMRKYVQLCLFLLNFAIDKQGKTKTGIKYL